MGISSTNLGRGMRFTFIGARPRPMYYSAGHGIEICRYFDRRARVLLVYVVGALKASRIRSSLTST